jgi:hypothetical protein
MSSINDYIVSPYINNRISLSACGQGNSDTLEQFNVSTYTSGNPNQIGFCIQATLTPPLSTALPQDVKQTTIWVDALTSNVPFTIDTLDLNLSPVSTIVNVNDTILMDKSLSIQRKTTISAGSIEVRDTINDPYFGDPINTTITPNLIQFQNGNSNNQTASMNVSGVNLFNSDSGFVNDITVSNITIQDLGGSQINNISRLGLTIGDAALGLTNTIDAGSITTNNWSITTPGEASFSTLTVDSIALVTTLSLIGTTLNIPLGGHAIDKSWAITLNNNVTVLNPTTGINGGTYKIWLTVGVNPRTFTKACGVVNDLLGDTLMAANSIWLIEIFRRSAGNYRARFSNFT